MLCKRCEIFIEYSGRGRFPKYCKKCASEIKKYKDMMRLRRKRSIGGSFLWSHRIKDFEEEHVAILKEKKRIGI